ncbi:MAG: TonB-dependent receptor, partial [Bryobacterales bacterium]|nr:TonB-dependent receptor [Bryobacterales bacterium]
MKLLTFAVGLSLFSAVLFGQAGTGTITGTVTDPAGAVVANAAIEVRNTETNVPYPTVTTETGAYTVLRLPPGPYSVIVTAAGFKKLTRGGLTVDAGQTLPLDLTLEVGSASESVTVTAEATLLKTESGDLTHNITLEQLTDLPILGVGTANAGSNGIRNPYNAVIFLPGVSYFANFNMIVNGAPTNTAGYRIEGLDNTNHTVAFAIMQNMPNADAIQEMAVQTSNYAPEFGQAGGGLFNITMKSGTNQFHGTGFEYYVNEFLNAGDPFSFNSGTPGAPAGGKYRPSNRRNDYGGTFSGPVWIPKLYNGKDKTFFFFSYERYKEDQALTFTDTLPNAMYQAGDFSAISPNGGAGFNTALGVPAGPIATDALGRPVFANEIYDPLTRSTTGGVGFANPFPNNMIPLTRFSPVALAVQKVLPALSNNGLYNNYNGYNLGERITTIPSIKVDQIIGSKQKLAFYYHHTETDAQYTTPNGNADGLPDLLTGARGSIPIGGPTYRVNYDYTITPTLLAHFGAGYSMIYFYDHSPWTQQGKTVDCQALLQLQGCEGSYNFPTIIAGNVTSPINLGGMQQLGNALLHTATHTERPSSNVNMTWIRGSHTYKAGAEVWWQAQITAPPTGVGLTYATLSNPAVIGPAPSGSVTNAGATGIPASLVTGAYTPGFPYANFLLGDVTAATQYAPVDARMYKTQWALFLQDSWKVTRKLTVDYGLRWDYATAPRESHGRSANLGVNVPNPAAGGRLGAPIFEATCNCTFVSNYPYAIGPRLGIAYQLDAKTVLRGGWGLAYGFAPDINIQNTANITNTATGVSAYLPLNTPGTIPQPAWPNFSAGQTPLPGSITSGFLSFLDPGASRPPRQNQWSIGVQREITHNTVIEASYVGNRGVWWTGPLGYLNQVSPQAFAAYGLSPYTNPTDNLLLGQTLASSQVVSRLGNILPYSGYSTGNTLLNALRPFPQFSTITVTNSPTGNTWYDSLQMKGTKRLSHGLQVNGTFTWSKAMVRIRPNLFVPSDKSIQPTDQPFLFNANIVYTTQRWFQNRFVNTVVRDWNLGAFLQYGSGLPLTPPAATNTNYIGGSEQFRVPGQPLYLKNLNCGCINPYTDVVLNPAAWTNPANGTFGPATGTYYSDFRQARRPQENFNLGRTFKFGTEGRYALQLRGEFVNIFNRTQIGNPSTNAPGSPASKNSYGQYSAGFGV